MKRAGLTRPITFAALVAGALAFTSEASAQSFGAEGDVSFAADRLMGMYFVDRGGRDDDDFHVGLGAPPFFAGAPYTMPRLGVDFFLIDQLSLGGSLAIWLDADDDDGAGQDGVLVAPRVGYAIPISDSFGFWVRGGFTFWDIERDDEVDLTGEGLFFWTPGDAWGFHFGPTLDLGLVGDGGEGKSFGLVAAGVFGWL